MLRQWTLKLLWLIIKQLAQQGQPKEYEEPWIHKQGGRGDDNLFPSAPNPFSEFGICHLKILN